MGNKISLCYFRTSKDPQTLLVPNAELSDQDPHDQSLLSVFTVDHSSEEGDPVLKSADSFDDYRAKQ